MSRKSRCGATRGTGSAGAPVRRTTTGRVYYLPISEPGEEGLPRSAQSSVAGAQSLQRPRRRTTGRSRSPPTIVR
jgi:hypothetical protein